MRTVVSSGNDALNLLFEAAHHKDVIDSQEISRQAEGGATNVQAVADGELYETPRSTISKRNISVHGTSRSDVESLARCSQSLEFLPLCPDGWFSAEEAVTYVDLFFKISLPFLLSCRLLLKSLEPQPSYFGRAFLCSTILMISSRYNVLPGVGGASRGYFIHDRLWEHCQRFVMRIMLGQEKASNARTRTVGSIEALLLISEWHPRALHFPTASDGWDLRPYDWRSERSGR